MAVIQNVNEVDNLIKLNHVIVSCTDKRGLVSDEGISISDFPANGILGRMAELNPDITFISTGETYNIINGFGLNAIEMSSYTGYPEMKTGLVKSLHPRIHAGILGHLKTLDDFKFMQKHNIPAIDAVIVNFYDLQKMISNNSTFESMRQAVDIGGPTLCHASRKAFISTAIVASPAEYVLLLEELEKNNGYISLECRLELAKRASSHYTQLMLCVDEVFQKTDYTDLKKCYKIIE